MSKTTLTPKLMHLKPDKARALEALAKRLGVKQSELMREGIDLVLKRYATKRPS